MNECDICGEDHGSDVDEWAYHADDVVAQRAGASNRTADELARVFADDVADHAVIWDDGYMIYRLSPSDEYLDAMLTAYVECALWSSVQHLDDETPGSTMDEDYGPDDIAPEALASMRADVVAFATYQRADLANIDAGQAGHDFWLTRNGHGAGFWDRGLGEVGDRLTDACKPYGSSDLYVGDDGRVYVS